jgi:hypothetical protein
VGHYAALGVEPDVSGDEIASAYRELARRYHPDVNPDDPDTEERFKEIQRAFEVLGNPEKRAKYDNTIRVMRRPRYDPNIEKVHINPPPERAGYGPLSHTIGRVVIIILVTVLVLICLAIFIPQEYPVEKAVLGWTCVIGLLGIVVLCCIARAKL